MSRLPLLNINNVRTSIKTSRVSLSSCFFSRPLYPKNVSQSAIDTEGNLKVNLWSCFCREMKRKEEEESKTAALTDEDEEEEEAPTEAGASDDDKDEGSAADEDGGDEDDGDDDKDQDASGEEKNLKKTGQDKKCVPGIIYLGHIPPRLRPKHLRNLLSVYGEIGRIFLQPEGDTTVSKHYTSHDPQLLPQRETVL